MIGHVHDFRGKAIVDRCHYVEIRKTCKDCGHVHQDISVRDFRLNPMQVAFADENCQTCRSMLKARGLEPASWSHV